MLDRIANRSASVSVLSAARRLVPFALAILGSAAAARAQEMGVWRFEDPDVSGFADSGSVGNDAQVVLSGAGRSKIRLKATRMGHGLLFPGKDARVVVDEQTSFDLAAGVSRTMEVWISGVKATGQEMGILGRQSASDTAGYAIVIAADGTARVRLRDATGETQEVSSGVNVADRGPHQVVVVRDWPRREIRIHVDGALATTVGETAPGNYGSGTLTFGALAGAGGALGSWFRGVLEEVRILGEVNFLYRADAVAVGRWGFDEGRGGTAADSSDSGDDFALGSPQGGAGKPAWEKGVLGSALRFNGRKATATATETVPLNFGPDDSWAISLWVKGKALGRMQGILSRGTTGTTEGTTVYVSLEGNLVAQARDQFGTNMFVDSGVAFGEDRSYHHLLFIRDYTVSSHTGAYRLLVDGVFRGGKAEVSSGTFDAGTLRLGAVPEDWTGGASPLAGSVDGLTILRWVK